MTAFQLVFFSGDFLHLLDRIVAGEGNEATEGQREGEQHLGSRVQPCVWINQLVHL